MSDNKRPYDDEKVDINNLNDDLDKTKVFNINSKNNESDNNGNYVSKHSLANDEYGDDFSDEDGEISSYSQSDKSNYKDDYNMEQVDDEPKPIVSRTDTYGSPEQKKNNNKKPLIIGLIVAAVVLIVVAVILVFNSCGKNKNDDTTTSTTDSSTTVTTTTYPEYSTYEETSTEYTTETELATEETTEPTTEETTTEEVTTEPETTTNSQSGGNAVYANFAPYKCVTPNGDVISDDFAKELNGDVSLSLNNDGTFSLKVGNIANESGNYEIDGNAITLGSYDGNIAFDNSGNPVGVTVYVDDYTVSFN